MTPIILDSSDARYPMNLSLRMGASESPRLRVLGNLDLLLLRKTGLFCSVRCPGYAILRTYDQAADWRDDGCCVISGFHSPIEEECLRILLRGTQPIIVCLSGTLPKRIPAPFRRPIAAGRLLMLSSDRDCAMRNRRRRASYRNDIVAACSDEVCFAHITPGGEADRLSKRLSDWAVPFRVIS